MTHGSAQGAEEVHRASSATRDLALVALLAGCWLILWTVLNRFFPGLTLAHEVLNLLSVIAIFLVHPFALPFGEDLDQNRLSELVDVHKALLEKSTESSLAILLRWNEQVGREPS
ncbi:hypothetical protein NWF24_17695 [Variovorax paradoxus]|uniref:hypothetical protein n=1 Tax=Variovorax paradoxus TaxID=34073 RepID=UPI0021ABBF8D|nr:hypothetical protein [Variovorax paradoxus]UVH54680.1 hypothetical protein NWF24_17695 [Variovorax paradoxus]